MQEEITQQKTDQDKMQGDGFEVHLGSFSGPLDLLCCLVESHEVDAVKLNLTDLVTQYMNFLIKIKGATLNELAEFFLFASRILLRKVESLFNKNDHENDAADIGEHDFIDDCDEQQITLDEIITRYKPYRIAASYLAKAKLERECSFIRVTNEEDYYSFDIGDLETLAAKWWEILATYDERNKIAENDAELFFEEIPDAVPEEQQIEERMNELMLLLKQRNMNLHEIVADHNVKTLIITLLALLELAHMGLIKLMQKETLGGVEIAAN